jgi:hypothetical protein
MASTWLCCLNKTAADGGALPFSFNSSSGIVRTFDHRFRVGPIARLHVLERLAVGADAMTCYIPLCIALSAQRDSNEPARRDPRLTTAGCGTRSHRDSPSMSLRTENCASTRPRSPGRVSY